MNEYRFTANGTEYRVPLQEPKDAIRLICTKCLVFQPTNIDVCPGSRNGFHNWQETTIMNHSSRDELLTKLNESIRQVEERFNLREFTSYAFIPMLPPYQEWQLGYEKYCGEWCFTTTRRSEKMQLLKGSIMMRIQSTMLIDALWKACEAAEVKNMHDVEESIKRAEEWVKRT